MNTKKNLAPDRSGVRSTLEDVARAAGVSVSTASRALAGKGQAYRISLNTVERIKTIARQLAFEPSLAARGLRLQKSGLIGVVIPDLSNYFFAQVARCVSLGVETMGFATMVADSREDVSNEERLIQTFIQRGVEGLVVCPVGNSSQHLERMEAANIPLVLVDRIFPKTKIVSVTADHLTAAYELTKRLLGFGVTRFGVLQGTVGTYPNTMRLLGIKKAMKEHGVSLDSKFISGHSFSERSGQDSIEALKGYGLKAWFSFSNQISIGALRALRSNAETMAEHQFAGFDDHPCFELLDIPVHFAEQPVQLLGQRASQLLLNQLEFGKINGSSASLPPLEHLPIPLVERLPS